MLNQSQWNKLSTDCSRSSMRYERVFVVCVDTEGKERETKLASEIDISGPDPNSDPDLT